MVKTLRYVAGALVTILLLMGFVASSVSSLNGSAFAYAEKADSPPIRLLALIILASAIGFGFFTREEEA